MGFADDVKKWTDARKAEMDDAISQVKANAERRLQEVLGEDVTKITGGVFDAATGKFYDMQAPVDVLEKMRQANLLRD